MEPHRLDVYYASHVCRYAAILLPPDDLPAIVDYERAAAESVDRSAAVFVDIVSARVGRHHIHIVIQGPCSTLDFEQLIAGCGMWVRSAINHLGAVERQRPRILRIGSFVSHHDPKLANLGVRDGPEGIERATVLLHPPVEDV